MAFPIDYTHQVQKRKPWMCYFPTWDHRIKTSLPTLFAYGLHYENLTSHTSKISLIARRHVKIFIVNTFRHTPLIFSRCAFRYDIGLYRYKGELLWKPGIQKKQLCLQYWSLLGSLLPMENLRGKVKDLPLIWKLKSTTFYSVKIIVWCRPYPVGL